MFYSHEVLTSRKYGVATVWLVATLGQKSNLKKINRKAILEVDVQKACRTIIDPAAPMALRLQGNLLYGVSRVYLQQCGYVLADAQHAHTTMRVMLKTVQDMALDPDAGKARPEQLVLPDDPSFLPEFGLPPPELFGDLELAFPLTTPRSGESQSLTPFGSQTIPGTPGGPVGELLIPSSSPGGTPGFQVQGDDGLGSVGRPSGIAGAEEPMEEPLADPEFEFDADGNLLDLTGADAMPATPALPGGTAMSSDAGASARVRQEHEDGQRADPQHFEDMDLDLPILGDDLPEAEAFPVQGEEHFSDQPEIIESTSSVAAPLQRKKRAPRVLTLDNTTELRNKDLAAWSTNYLETMKEVAKSKNEHRAAAQAKKNAEYFVWGAGIGGVGPRLMGATGPTPFDSLYGDGLFKLYTGVDRNATKGTKRDRDSGIDEATEGEARLVRHKTQEPEEEVGRGMEDEAMFMPGGDDVELPREAPSALDDQQLFSAMPWNITASIRGSSVVPRSARTGMPGTISGLASLTGRRGSRLISASPLHGRGQPGGLEALEGYEGGDDLGELGMEDFAFPGPGASSDGYQGDPEGFPQQSLRVREALSAEGENFLAFVSDAIIHKRNQTRAGLEHMADILQAEAAGDIDEVLFQDLIPPADNSKMVACQGLMMVLSLGTRGLLDVQQDEDFGEIGLSLSEKARGMEAAAAAELEGQQAESGQFEEQFVAGAHAARADDHDSLYGISP